MKNLKFIDYPKYFALSEYDRLIDKILNQSKKYSDIISIYQIGSISNPGISDIDLIFIFKDEKKCVWNPIEKLSKKEKYLLVHNCFGASESFFQEVQKFSFFHNYKLLSGKDIYKENEIEKSKVDILKRQIALEYLLKMYITLTVQLNYGIIKLRSLLLEIKAIKYDLEFLNINTCELLNTINNLITWRNSWFDFKPSEKELSNWVLNFHNQLTEFIINNLSQKNIFIPHKNIFHFSKNIIIKKSEKLNYNRKGFALSRLFYIDSRRFFNINNRLNKFLFLIPWNINATEKIIEERYNFIKRFFEYNQEIIPYYYPLSSSLKIW